MSMKLFNRVLIANRGEIAIRIIKTLRKLGIESVAIYSKDDKDAYYTTCADFKVLLEGEDLFSTYLDMDKIIRVAKRYACDAIHPGYGFLSENPDFAKLVQSNKICFIGPHPEAISVMGNKVEARKIATEAGLSLPGGASGSIDDIIKQSADFDYPVLIKAAAGGGGKGMQIAYDQDELKEKLKTTSREANAYFGNAEVFVEKYFERPRHIEIQVAADQHGNAVHLYERECSIQRRYQKIVEEAPAPNIDRDLIQEMGMAAIDLCRKVGYDSIGTVEFLVDEREQFYFLEMNTRIQVEHAITEEVYSYDMVELQLRSAAGRPLGIQQSDIIAKGHAIECRVYAEDPSKDFLPSPGKLWFYQNPPKTKFLRVESSLNKAQEVSSLFDPMISKLVVWGRDREEALQEMGKALSQYVVYGCQTNISYLRTLIRQHDFVQGAISTAFIKEHHLLILKQMEDELDSLPKCFPAMSYLAYDLLESARTHHNKPWSQITMLGNRQEYGLAVNEKLLRTSLREANHKAFSFDFNGDRSEVEILGEQDHYVKLRINDRILVLHIAEKYPGKAMLSLEGVSFLVERKDVLQPPSFFSLENQDRQNDKSIVSPMPGKVIQLNVKQGDKVLKGHPLLSVESMKMENAICAPEDGVVANLYVGKGELIDANVPLIELKDIESNEL